MKKPYANTNKMRQLNKSIRSGRGGKAQLARQRKRRAVKGGIKQQEG